MSEETRNPAIQVPEAMVGAENAPCSPSELESGKLIVAKPTSAWFETLLIDVGIGSFTDLLERKHTF